MSRWNDDTMLKFISLYEGEPVLWDVKHAHYKNKSARKAALEKIVNGINIPDFDVKECRIKIKNLRSHYWQEIGKIQNSEMRYKPTVVWFTGVDRFLRRCSSHDSTSKLKAKSEIKKTPGTGTGTGMDLQIDIEAVKKETEVDELYKNLIDKSEFCNENPKVSNENQSDGSKNKKIVDGKGRRSKKRLKVSNTVTPPVQEPFNKLEIIHSESLNADNETEFDIWAKSVAKQLNDMAIPRALDVQFKMQSVLTKERLLGYPQSSISSGIQQINGICYAEKQDPQTWNSLTPILQSQQDLSRTPCHNILPSNNMIEGSPIRKTPTPLHDSEASVDSIIISSANSSPSQET